MVQTGPIPWFSPRLGCPSFQTMWFSPEIIKKLMLWFLIRRRTRPDQTRPRKPVSEASITRAAHTEIFVPEISNRGSPQSQMRKRNDAYHTVGCESKWLSSFTASQNCPLRQIKLRMHHLLYLTNSRLNPQLSWTRSRPMV